MFFSIHSERKIGFKELTQADLGLGESSHQTHIGLYGNKGMLSFLKDEDFTNAILIYNDYCDVLLCDFDRIENPDGTFRSPKIRLGDPAQNTIVRQIRKFAKINQNKFYYLLWFGLDNNELLFWLMDNESEDLKKIKQILPNPNNVYDESQANFGELIRYLEKKIDKLSINLQAELELISQTSMDANKYKISDIEKAQKIFKERGKIGEELINTYLEKMKSEKKIIDFTWMNKSRESYKPFDFVVNTEQVKENFIDVKTTSYKFEQPAVFSESEIDFVTKQIERNYSVYRVYSVNKNASFKICNDCFDYMTSLNGKIQNFKSEIKTILSAIKQLNLLVNPSNKTFKKISSEISLVS